MANNASAVYMADQFFPYLAREAVDEQDMRNLAAACELMAKRALEAADKLEASVEVDVEALRTAAHEGNLALVARQVLRAGAPVNAADGNGHTALMLAAWSGHVKIAKLLLSKGADVNATNVHGGTALMNAAVQGHAAMVELLVEYGADAHSKLEDGTSAADLVPEIAGSKRRSSPPRSHFRPRSPQPPPPTSSLPPAPSRLPHNDEFKMGAAAFYLLKSD